MGNQKAKVVSNPVEKQNPLRLAPRYAEALWGGRRLGDVLRKPLPDARPIGESWEIFGKNLIVDGHQAGLTLDEAAQQYGTRILGTRVLARRGDGSNSAGFPLLIKFIDAHLPLSVQVHPDDAFAQQNEAGSRGKTEAWYILDAPPGSELVYGLRERVDRERIATSIEAGLLERELTFLKVRPGDAVFVPSGTVHAIGDGILLYEVQQRSEITYRLYDWGRVGPDGQPRELHLEKALAVLRVPQPAPRTTAPLTLSEQRGRRTFLAACEYFALEAIDGTIDAACDGESFAALSVVSGSARLRWSGGEEALELGESIVLPAALGSYRLEVPDGGRVLRATVPDLRREVVGPLQAAGYTLDQIGRLGAVVT